MKSLGVSSRMDFEVTISVAQTGRMFEDSSPNAVRRSFVGLYSSLRLENDARAAGTSSVHSDMHRVCISVSSAAHKECCSVEFQVGGSQGLLPEFTSSRTAPPL